MQTYTDGGESWVEAVQLTAENVQEVADWCDGVIVTEHNALQHDLTNVGINYKGPTGMARISEGQYLMKDGSGNFFRHNADYFERFYTPAKNPNDSESGV